MNDCQWIHKESQCRGKIYMAIAHGIAITIIQSTHNQLQVWIKTHIGRNLRIHDVPPIADKCLDAALTPRNNKSDFQAIGNFSIDRNVFTAGGFLVAGLSVESQTTANGNDNPWWSSNFNLSIWWWWWYYILIII